MRAWLLVCAVAALGSCGGGGGEASAPSAAPPPARDTATRASAAGDSMAVPLATIGGLQARRTDAGLVADLLSATRAESRLVVTVRFRNATTDTLAFALPAQGGAYPGTRLTAGGRAWPLAREEDGDVAAPAEFDIVVAPGQSRLWRAEFVAPPGEVPSFDLRMPGVATFVDVPIRDE